MNLASPFLRIIFFIQYHQKFDWHDHHGNQCIVLLDDDNNNSNDWLILLIQEPPRRKSLGSDDFFSESTNSAPSQDELELYHGVGPQTVDRPTSKSDNDLDLDYDLDRQSERRPKKIRNFSESELDNNRDEKRSASDIGLKKAPSTKQRRKVHLIN